MIFFLFAAASCTVDMKLEIHDDASGRAEVTVTLHPVAVMYMADITMSFSGAGASGPFDIDAIRRAFLARPGIKLETIETVNDNTLRLTALFDDVRNLLAPPEDAAADGNPITFNSSRGGRVLRLQLIDTHLAEIILEGVGERLEVLFLRHKIFSCIGKENGNRAVGEEEETGNPVEVGA